MVAEIKTGTFPKFGCRACGSTEIEGKMDTYPVYRAVGDKLRYIRVESLEADVSELACAYCGERVNADGAEDALE